MKHQIYPTIIIKVLIAQSRLELTARLELFFFLSESKEVLVNLFAESGKTYDGR